MGYVVSVPGLAMSLEGKGGKKGKRVDDGILK